MVAALESPVENQDQNLSERRCNWLKRNPLLLLSLCQASQFLPEPAEKLSGLIRSALCTSGELAELAEADAEL
ncbi:hypothetical protein ACROYT_G023986 [Oculina patagonica]